MRRKNTIEIYFQAVLISFFISLRLAEAITWKNFVPAKRDRGRTKEGSRLAGMNFLHVIVGCNL